MLVDNMKVLMSHGVVAKTLQYRKGYYDSTDSIGVYLNSLLRKRS